MRSVTAPEPLVDLSNSNVPASRSVVSPLMCSMMTGSSGKCGLDRTSRLDVRTRVDEASPQRADHRQDPRVSDVKPVAGQLDSSLGFASRRRLREEAVLLKIVFPALPWLGASDAQMRSTASWALVLSNGVPKTPAQTLRGERLEEGLVHLTVLARQSRFLVFLALRSYVRAPPLPAA